jgi:predicted Zn-ribbon and HTH transcriptional regulator
MENQRQKIELADIFIANKEEFFKNNIVYKHQGKVFDAITKCRTFELGCHVEQCDNCGHIEQSYNSCRNRHCPKCQYIKKEQWVDKISSKIPKVKQFHVVFTLPKCLRKLFYINQSKAYSLFFKSAWESMSQTAKNPKHFGAEIGAIGLLHTWGQNLVYHPHIHFIVPAGGLDEDNMEWIVANKNFFLSVKVLSKVFRGKLYNNIAKEIKKKKIKLPDDIASIAMLKSKCYEKDWVVYCEKPFSNPNNLIKYLSNYIHRVAISNNRIISHKDDKVSFTYKDYKTAGISRIISLKTDEFIRRFLQHVLPFKFYKIRYFGIMSIANTNTKLKLIYDLIDKVSFYPVLQGLSTKEVLAIITGINPFICPKCNIGKMKTIEKTSFNLEYG